MKTDIIKLVPSRPLLNFKNPCNSIDYRGFSFCGGGIGGGISIFFLNMTSNFLLKTF